MQLHTADGMRKYLTAGDRDAFLREADPSGTNILHDLAYAGSPRPWR
jgi:hypothetical protein